MAWEAGRERISAQTVAVVVALAFALSGALLALRAYGTVDVQVTHHQIVVRRRLGKEVKVPIDEITDLTLWNNRILIKRKHGKQPITISLITPSREGFEELRQMLAGQPR